MSKTYFIVICIVIVSFVGSLILIFSSPWLIWSALPNQAGNKVVIDTKVLNGSSRQWISSVSQNLGVNPLSAYQADSSQLGFSQSDSLTYAVIRPKLGRSDALSTKMMADDWSVSQEKLFIIAQKGQKNALLTREYGLSRMIQLMWDTFYISIVKSQGLFPLAIGNIQNINQQPLTKPISFILSSRSGHIRMNGVVGSDILAIDQAEQTVSTASHTENNLLVAVPSSFIKYLPASLAKKINEVINSSLSIKHTSPNILSVIQDSSNVQVSKAGEALELVMSNPQKDVLAKLKQIIESDDQYDFPKKHSFYLPDKTLAYEYVPGKTASNWEVYNGNCQLYKGKDASVYICQNQNSLVVTTNKENTATANEIVENKWLIIDKSNKLNMLGSGDDKNFHIKLEN